ncbi:hypothetical protein CJ030_MR8G024976 [Morella rubra]|uniref:Uncharacterized protein n=1 Tax=Morella rubra TaxID=262757 RepID=A0A6A1URI0_9ROSI|nr:hypothetical protein CJ030_MR8G024976 [Morella rubra]
MSYQEPYPPPPGFVGNLNDAGYASPYPAPPPVYPSAPPYDGYPSAPLPPPPPGYPGYPPPQLQRPPYEGYQGYFGQGYPPPCPPPSQQYQHYHYEHHQYEDQDGCTSILRGWLNNERKLNLSTVLPLGSSAMTLFVLPLFNLRQRQRKEQELKVKIDELIKEHGMNVQAFRKAESRSCRSKTSSATVEGKLANSKRARAITDNNKRSLARFS